MTTLAIGFFDGVHLGHQAILRGADLAVTFRNHPLSVLAPSRSPKLIMAPEERIAALGAFCARTHVIEFTPELAILSPSEFVDKLRRIVVAEGLCPDAISVRAGANWRFGKGGAGDAQWLRSHGFDATVVPFAEYCGKTVSSTRIRAAIAAGRMPDASAMLGREFAVSGRVVSGKGLGRSIGFPTLNIHPAPIGGAERIEPPKGVYAVSVAGARAVANFGVAPTLGAQRWREATWEVHLLEPAELPGPGCEMRFGVRRFLRAERKFGGIDELKLQIAADCVEAQCD